MNFAVFLEGFEGVCVVNVCAPYGLTSVSPLLRDLECTKLSKIEVPFISMDFDNVVRGSFDIMCFVSMDLGSFDVMSLLCQ